MLTLERARSWYPGNDAVHGFDHVERVYRMAERLAELEGADMEIVRAAALLHDVEGSEPGVKIAPITITNRQILLQWYCGRKAGQTSRSRLSSTASGAHRFRGDGEAPQTLEAQVLFDADKLDVLGAIGTARTIAYAVMAGTPVFTEPSEQFFQTGKGDPRRGTQCLSRVPV